MKFTSLVTAALGAALLLSGCAHSKPPGSGFLGADSVYESMEPHPEESGAWRWVEDGFSLGDYQSMYVERVEVMYNADADPEAADAEEVERLRTFFHDEIKRVFAETHEWSDDSGVGVLRLRLALTELDPNIPALNILPHTTLTGLGQGGATFEGEAFDGVTEKRVAMLLATADGDRYRVAKNLTTWGAPEQVITYWAELIKEFWDKQHGHDD